MLLLWDNAAWAFSRPVYAGVVGYVEEEDEWLILWAALLMSDGRPSSEPPKR
jgi:hypothetical protein